MNEWQAFQLWRDPTYWKNFDIHVPVDIGLSFFFHLLINYYSILTYYFLQEMDNFMIQNGFNLFLNLKNLLMIIL